MCPMSRQTCARDRRLPCRALHLLGVTTVGPAPTPLVCLNVWRRAMADRAQAAMLGPPRPSSTYHHSASHSRQPSYHSPMMTPNAMPVHDGSPPMGASGSSQSSDSTPQTPGSASGHITEGDRPPLAPINTHIGGENAVAGPSRGGSQYNTPGGSPSNSPRASLNGLPSPNRGFARSHSQRPMSMNSLSSRSYLHVGPSGGAPHQRPVVLEMPKRLGARPDGNGDFFYSVGRLPESSSGLGLDEMGRVRRNSRPMDDYPTSPLRSTHPGPPSARRPLATPSSEAGPSGSRPPVPRTTTARTEPPEDPQVVLGRSEPPV
ncbi:hypothetical protein, variant [Cryptococcus amylolentus CBS 6039]|uniref:Uncharacterized protein n=1 Tax=Cryptococcus amylolentus CBS 6039 TaxID=1295533 RepID=A0A1E3HI63_9TREE|nr:hypothetical protein L202_05983 [Cryptococcus amylolentus CBS 6039]XP_018991565.1 hypothetical protein, variant [Cryptococcus amylolentus CBS 6039]ODN76033.1 hypothetical protein L202_05983 [Cryptococcus amylolentus CBS 6039]ODN76034.1 hypothetical protein, variant [Cryptococcus amylolentus CBS 6039]